MKTIKLIFWVGLTAMITWSCSNSSPVSANGEFSPSPYANASRVPVQADSLTSLSQKIPGFGGLFINESGQLSIYLTDPATQKAKAKKVLSSSELITKALSNTSASVNNITIKKGQFTFIQLNTWRTEVSGNILAMNGVYSGGIDQSQNKLSFGVKNKTVKDNVTEKLAGLNIPKNAVIFYQMSPPENY